ncbi:exosome complex component MTR3 [Rhodotorula paludigena]|uniref:exosome complex component MTR3 n=1 Tax=Rhodotorula paludigena TaxID=86838 RepID=UPI003177DE40
MQAQDRRRFTAPEGAAPLRFNDPTDAQSSPPSTSRLDGREAAQVRPVFLKPGLVTEAAGSAYVEAGRTKVLCAVYGPKPTPPSAPFNAKARLNVEVKFAPFASGVRRFVPGKDTEATALAAVVQQSLVPSLLLETMPKSQIDLFVTVLESDGWDGDLSIGVTAASVALAEAGIGMRGIVTSCSAAILPSTSTAVLDPTRDEVQKAASFVTLACMPALGTVTNLRVNGVVASDALAETLARAYEVCGLLHGVAGQALLAARQAAD